MSILRPKSDNAGRYYRNIGYTSEGSRQQPKLYLGRDEIQATERLARIVRLWEWVKNALHEEGSQPIWGPFLDVAKAIGAGETVYKLPSSRFPANPAAYAAALAGLSLCPPVIQIEADNSLKETEGQDQLRQIGERFKLDEKAERAVQVAETWRQLSGQRPIAGDLHEVLNTFCEHLKTAYHDPEDDAINDHGKTKQRQCKTLLRLLPATPLAELDYARCQEIYNVLRNRPKKTDGQLYERKTCQHLIAALTQALDFADMSNQWAWELPTKFARIKKTVARVENDNSKRVEVITYSLAEIKTLWRFARPMERLLVALALNCGMGADQIGRLTIDRVVLRDDKPCYIKSRRFKRDVVGRWRLWSVTERLLRWAIANRPHCDHNLLVVNRRGKSLYGRSKKRGS